MREIGLPEVLVICGILFLFGLLLVLAVGLLHRKRRDSVQRTLVEKFASAHDLAAFLETPGGQRFAESLSGRFSNPRESVLGSIHNGILLSLLGLGLLVISVWRQMPAMGIPAVLVMCLGVGFVLSAFVTYHLSKSWGMCDKPSGVDTKKPVER